MNQIQDQFIHLYYAFSWYVFSSLNCYYKHSRNHHTGTVCPQYESSCESLCDLKFFGFSGNMDKPTDLVQVWWEISERITKMLTICVVWRKLASIIVSEILLLIIIVRIIYQVELNSFISTMSILNMTLQTMLGITSVTTFTTRKRFFSSVYDHMSLNFWWGLHNACTVRTTILLRSKFDWQEQNLKKRKIGNFR